MKQAEEGIVQTPAIGFGFKLASVGHSKLVAEGWAKVALYKLHVGPGSGLDLLSPTKSSIGVRQEDCT